MFDEIPGALSLTCAYCLTNNGTSPCAGHIVKPAPLIIVASVLDYAIPAVIVLVCMVLQVIYLYRNLSETHDSTFRRVAVTIFLVSTLFFTCHIAFIGGLIYWYIHIGFKHDPDRPEQETWYMREGEYMAVGQFILPLLNSYIYP